MNGGLKFCDDDLTENEIGIISVVFIDVLQVCHLGIIYEVEDNNNLFSSKGIQTTDNASRGS